MLSLCLRLALLALLSLSVAPSARVFAAQPVLFKTYLPAVSNVAAPLASPVSSQQQAMATAINTARVARGLAPLRLEPVLYDVAQGHSETMASAACLAHQCPGEAPLGDRITAAGYPWSGCGETIGRSWNYDVGAMLAAWLASEPHRAILLSPTLEDLGIGYACSPLDGLHYWTADLAAPAG